MAQKRKKRVAVVQCSGGSCTQTELPRESYGADCAQAAEKHPEGDVSDLEAAYQYAGWVPYISEAGVQPKLTGRSVSAAGCV